MFMFYMCILLFSFFVFLLFSPPPFPLTLHALMLVIFALRLIVNKLRFVYRAMWLYGEFDCMHLIECKMQLQIYEVKGNCCLVMWC
jgi:hypothetical protein